MDRALGCGPKGCEFDSRQARIFYMVGCRSGLSSRSRKPCGCKPTGVRISPPPPQNNMTREFSAGGIVFKKQETRNKKQRAVDLLWLVCQHSQHKGWVFPKGLIGDHKDGETSQETAVREVEEETGVKAKIICKLKNPATYWYVWQKDKRFKTVYYFLMEEVGGDIAKHDHEMSAVEWIATEHVNKRLTYKSDKKAFEEALILIEQITGDK